MKGFCSVAKLAVFATPTAANKAWVAGADVAVVGAVGEAASAMVGARAAPAQDHTYACGPLLASSFAVPFQLLKEKERKRG